MNHIINKLFNCINDYYSNKFLIEILESKLKEISDEVEAESKKFSYTQRLKNKEELYFLIDFNKHMSSQTIRDQSEIRRSEMFYRIYNSINKIYYCMTSKEFENKEENYIIKNLKQSNWCALREDITSNIENNFEKTWKLLDETCNKEKIDFSMPRKVKDNFTFYDGQVLLNQIHLNDLDEKILQEVRNFIINNDINYSLKKFFNSNIGVANVRCWRYINVSKKINTQHKQVDPHLDEIAPQCLKIMIFRGNIDEDSGCFEIMPSYPGAASIKAIGTNPVFICNTQALYHRAEEPKENKKRDLIEITIVPRFEDDVLVVHGGWHAGRPLNPFSKW